MTEIFRQAFVQAASDKLIDKPELNQLRQIKNDLQKTAPGSEPARVAARTLQSLDSYTGTTRVNQPIAQADGKPLYYDFKFTPTYGEAEAVPGKTPLEIVSHLSQGDELAETKQDNVRCAAATVLNAYLLLGGKFEDLPAKLGLKLESSDLTYGNAHRVQEAIYLKANVNGGDGLNISDSNRYDFQIGRITRPEVVGESRIAANLLGLKTHALMGPTREKMTEREPAVKAYLAQNPKAVFYLTVQGGPPVRAPQEYDKYNHAVTVYHEKGKFYLLDTGVNDNGAGRAMKPLNPAQVKELLYDNKGYVFGLSFAEPASQATTGATGKP
ncbi:MAG: hypothetical protein IV090_13920 [Candidatus Sericytochromatia bacterium]|nr:hypothetical protein [Candidatus Sericytochromatia bacterium]